MTEGELRPFVDNFEIPDPALTQRIVTHLKAQGIFDQFRRDCISDVDTKPAYQNLRQRVETSVRTFLSKNPWKPEMNKNQMRELLRKHLQSGTFLENGMDRIVDQVVNPKIYSMFLPKVEEVVRNCLKIDENNKPIFVPPPKPEIKPESFHQTITSRARVPAPLMGPQMSLNSNLEVVKTSSLRRDDDDSTAEDKVGDSASPDDSSQSDFLVDQNDVKLSTRGDDVIDDEEEDEEDEDEEESPPFEPHCEDDPQIMGIRSDSDSSSDDGLVVTIVDDNLEETIIDQTKVEEVVNDSTKIEVGKNQESSEESEESSSDEYVPKTPTINMEGSDGTVIEFNTVSEYKQYQTKFDEESFENVEEEVVSSNNWIDESNELKEEQSSNEENSVGESRKRKFNVDSLDEASSSSIDKGSTSGDEQSTFNTNNLKIYKIEEEDKEFDSNSEHNNQEYNLSSPDKSPDVSSPKHKSSDSENTYKSKYSSSSKDSDRSHKNHHHSHRDQKDDNNLETHSTGSVEKEHRNRSHREKNEYKHESSKHKHSKKHESSSSKHEKAKEKTTDKKLEDDHKNKNSSDVDKKESHEHKDKHSDSLNHSDRSKGKQDRNEKRSDRNQDTESPHKQEKDSAKNSKHSHSSSKHHHKSSSDKYKTETDSKHRDTSSKHSSHNKKREKEDKHKSKQKYREHCKSNDKDGEGRRSSDRDSSGPSGRSTSSSYSRQSSGRSRTEATADTSDKMSSNSDNAVSEHLETMELDASSSNFVREQIASPKPVTADDSQEIEISDRHQIDISNEDFQNSNSDYTDNENNNQTTKAAFSSKMGDFETAAVQTNDAKDSLDESGSECTKYMKKDDTYMDVDNESDSCNTPNLVRDSSSEKENIEQVVNFSVETEDSKVTKFKKPKIAANIFEVKKIMQARRNIKRLETMRLSKSSSEDDEVVNSSNNDLVCKDTETFKGFDEVVSTKNELYESLIERLSNEIDNLSKTKVPSIVTSWMEFDPKYDDYITNSLNGKVHRKVKVSVPPICEEFYEFDHERKLYSLRDNIDVDFVMKESVEKVSEEHIPTSNFDSCNSKTNLLEEIETLDASDLLLHDQPTQDTTKLSKTQNNKDDELQTDLSSITSDVGLLRGLSLSYNTYEDYIKSKEIDNVPQPKAPTPPQTVVKITNNKSSEQVIMKNGETDLKKTTSIPRITRMDSKSNGRLTRASNEQKPIALISRVKKVNKNQENKTQNLNGAVSPDSTTNSEEESPIEISAKMISEVIGIQSETLKQGKIREPKCLKEKQPSPEQKGTRSNKQTAVRQRYDNSDLYKPRLQLASRRLKAQTVTETVSPTAVQNGRKRPHSLEKKTTPAKRRR